MADESGTFKIPSGDLKTLGKSCKSDLLGNKTDIQEDLALHDEPLSSNSEIPPVPYKEPSWSRKCEPGYNYSFEVIKNGVIIEKINQLQNKAYWLFGRLPNCDINMAHPTISRYHAVLQYRSIANEEKEHITREPGWYLYDLNSTHGTFLNKQRLVPNVYVRVRVGYMIKLGSSSRTFLLQGPPEDEDESSSFTITELKEARNKQKLLKQDIQKIELEEQERIAKLKEEEGIDWGMREDANEEADLADNPYAASNNEELFLDDPKKTLRGYFEREGLDLEYKITEASTGTYVCKVELPVDDYGQPIIAEVSHKGKKKEAVIQCALEACRILDRYGLLRQATHEPRRRVRKVSDSDDDDDFLDRTGDVERRRKRKETKSSNEAQTYEDLIRQEAEILERLEEIDAKIQRHQMIAKGVQLPENDDDVDEFLTRLSEDKPYDKFEVRRLRLEKEQLAKQHATVQKLIKIAKPLDIPSISKVPNDSSNSKKHLKDLPLFGKRIKLSKNFGIKKSEIKIGGSTSVSGEEVEEDDEETTAKTTSTHVPITLEDTKEIQKPKQVQGPLLNPQKPPSMAEDHQQPANDDKSKDKASEREHISNIDESTKRDDEIDGEVVAESSTSTSSKKKRNRCRIRERNRDNVDFDDTEEFQSEEKNIEWVPPENQTGDGFTSLNEKYGY